MTVGFNLHSMTRERLDSLDVVRPVRHAVQPAGWLGIMETGVFKGRFIHVIAFDTVVAAPNYYVDRWCVLDMKTGDVFVGVNDKVFE